MGRKSKSAFQPSLQLCLLYEFALLDKALLQHPKISALLKIQMHDGKTFKNISRWSKSGQSLVKGLPSIHNGIYDLKLKWIPTTSEQLLIFKEVELNTIGLHWAIKLEWNPQHKIPGDRKLIELYKPLGEFFRQVFLLCEKCHGRQRSAGYELTYFNAEEWFQLFWEEWMLMGIALALANQARVESTQKTAKVSRQDADKKRSIVRKPLKVWHTANQLENPLKDGSSFSTLLDVAIALSGQSQNFKTDYYQPFLDAWRKMITSFDSPEFKRHIVKDDVLYSQQGRGNAIKKVSYQGTFGSLTLQEFHELCKIALLEVLPCIDFTT